MRRKRAENDRWRGHSLRPALEQQVPVPDRHAASTARGGRMHRIAAKTKDIHIVTSGVRAMSPRTTARLRALERDREQAEMLVRIEETRARRSEESRQSRHREAAVALQQRIRSPRSPAHVDRRILDASAATAIGPAATTLLGRGLALRGLQSRVERTAEARQESWPTPTEGGSPPVTPALAARAAR